MKTISFLCAILFCFPSLIVNATPDNQPEKLTIYWDNSFSMGNQQRLLDDEINLLSEYLKELQNVSVEFVKFRLNENKIDTFQITDGEIQNLIEYVKKVDYEGGSDFSKILTNNDFKADIALLFTDGNSILNEVERKIQIPVFCINSIEKGNQESLSKISDNSGGAYIFLTKNNFDYSLAILKGKEKDPIPNDREIYYLKGKVYDENNKLLCGAMIKVFGEYNTAFTNNIGEFSIPVHKNDVLTISYLGKEEKSIEISDEKNLNVQLQAKKVIQIEEIKVEGKRKRKKETLMTPLGEKDKASIGYAYKELKSEDIKPDYQYLGHVLENKPGISVRRYGPNTFIFIDKNLRSSILNVKPPIIVVDGNIYHQPNQPNIDPGNIENIIIRSTLTGTNIYGSEGAFGVIEIITKTNSLMEKIEENSNPALAKGNDYDDKAVSLDSVFIISKDFEEIAISDSFDSAYQIYLRDKSENHTISYYIDVSDYFLNWDKKISLSILTNIMDIAFEDMNSLRVLAFKLEERGEEELAKNVYKFIAKKEPERIQSHRDLSLIYTALKDYYHAGRLYRKINSNQFGNPDYAAIQNVFSNELHHYVKFAPISEKRKFPDLYDPNYKTDIRLVFEWSIPDTEFELQFVNPHKKFFKWNHIFSSEQERMLAELESGFNIEEFILDDSKSGGEWMVNLKTHQNYNDENQAYLKYTIYKNYGLSDESKKIKVIKLDTNGKNATIDKFVY